MKALISAAAIAMLATTASVSSVAGHHEGGHEGGHDAKDMMAKANIVETAMAAGSFNTLVTAVKAAGLVETLSGAGPFTVFAPTDEAFAALPEGTVETLLKPENKDKLAAILTYHVLSGKVMSGDIAGKEMMVDTVQGSKADINAIEGVMIDDATVIKADIETSNGVIHVIDKVIMPAM